MKGRILMLVLMLMSWGAAAEVKLPALLCDNMVLQRNSTVNLWGEADPGRTVKVTTSWNGKTYAVKADSNGKWLVKVATADAGGPYTITFSDGKPMTVNNVLLGEVWICSGQSNMEIPMCGFTYQPVANSLEDIVDAFSFKGVRLFTVSRVSSAEPLDDCEGEWLESTPESVSGFSAVAWYFGRTLYKTLGIPIGLITPNWGGSNIETWMTEESIAAIDGIDMNVQKSWNEDNSIPQRLYNGMILPIHNYTSKGFIWYQGESNRTNWYDYKKLMVAMVDLWRKTWGDDKMPFYYTQLAPYRYEGNDLRSLPLVIEAQYEAAKEIPFCGIAATTDLGHETCIHPPKKHEVGQRLAFLALANDYDVKGLPAPAPTFKDMKIENGKVYLNFNNVSKVVNFREPDSIVGYGEKAGLGLKGFEVAGADGVFHDARAGFHGWTNELMVWCDDVPEPVAVRYAFKNYPEATVRTTMGQPLVPFRTDRFEVKDIWE